MHASNGINVSVSGIVTVAATSPLGAMSLSVMVLAMVAITLQMMRATGKDMSAWQ